MNTAETPLPVIVTVVLLLTLKWAVCQKAGEAVVAAGDLPCGSWVMRAGAPIRCRVKLLLQRLACASDGGAM
jgi:hypothetical protein